MEAAELIRLTTATTLKMKWLFHHSVNGTRVTHHVSSTGWKITFCLPLLPSNSHLVTAERKKRCNRHVLVVYFNKMGIQSQRLRINFREPGESEQSKNIMF